MAAQLPHEWHDREVESRLLDLYAEMVDLKADLLLHSCTQFMLQNAQQTPYTQV